MHVLHPTWRLIFSPSETVLTANAIYVAYAERHIKGNELRKSRTLKHLRPLLAFWFSHSARLGIARQISGFQTLKRLNLALRPGINIPRRMSFSNREEISLFRRSNRGINISDFGREHGTRPTLLISQLFLHALGKSRDTIILTNVNENRQDEIIYLAWLDKSLSLETPAQSLYNVNPSTVHRLNESRRF